MPAAQTFCFAPSAGSFGDAFPRRSRHDSWWPAPLPSAPAPDQKRGRPGLMFLLMLFASTFGAVHPAKAADQCPIPPHALPAEGTPAPPKITQWQAHFEHLRQTVTDPRMSTRRLLFIGDSLTYGWHADETLFYQSFKQFSPLNLGIFGDRTEGVIYRLNAAWGGLKPRLAVVLIGTNNTATGSSPSDVALAIAEIVRTIRVRSGETRVLIVSILPRGEKSSTLRAANNKLNEILASCANGETTFFADIAGSFLDESGGFRPELTSDNIHLTRSGYRQLASLILPTIKTLMTN
jgi:lysophospholipase L1-like esterase